MSMEVEVVEANALPSSENGQTVTSPAAENATPSSGTTAEQPASSAKVNWQNDPVYRAQQAERDRREAAIAQRLQALEQEKEAAFLATLSPDKRVEHESNKLKTENERLRSEIAYRDDYAQREKDIAALSETYGVPRHILENAASYNAAEKLGQEWQNGVKQAARKYDEFASRNEGAKDGAGASRTTNQSEAKFTKALAENDPEAALAALFED